MSRPVVIAAEGRDGQVIIRLGRDYWQMPATEAYEFGLAILRAVSEADGVAKALLADLKRPFTYTHRTDNLSYFDKHLEGCHYNPYRA